MQRRANIFAFALLLLGVVVSPVLVLGSQVGSLPTFSPGQPIRAADFNNAFTDFRDAINDNDTRIGNLANLQTTAKGDLVTAMNEVRQGVTGPQGPQGSTGAQGPQGPTRLLLIGQSSPPPGGNTNQWTTGATLAAQSSPRVRENLVAGRPFTATIRVQTADPSVAGGDTPGAPLVAGNLVLDLQWRFAASPPTGPQANFITQSAVATVVIDAAMNNNKTVTITGTVPATPNTPGGYMATHLAFVNVTVNAATTAQGQSYTTLDMEITPP